MSSNRNATVDTKDLVATIAYLIGVKKHIVEKCFDAECHELLQSLYASQPATTIRYLCKLRTALFLKYKKTDYEMRNNLKNLNTLEWYDAENIAQLEKWGIPIIKANYRSEKYMLDLNKLIANHIDDVAALFPDWCEWQYIRELFVIPHYNNPVALKLEFEKYMTSKMYYPFQVYIYWTPFDCGSMLLSDRKFLQIITAPCTPHPSRLRRDTFPSRGRLFGRSRASAFISASPPKLPGGFSGGFSRRPGW